MKANRLLEQLNDLPEDLLLEAQPKGIRPGFGWKRWGAVAACCCVVLGAVLLAPLLFFQNRVEPFQPVDYGEVVNYSTLSFGDTYLPEGLQIDSGNGTDSIMGIAGSVEEELVTGLRPMALLEVTVTNVRIKDYYYDTPDLWSDAPDGVLPQHDQTLLYDFQIDRVWYGGPFQAGETLTVENSVYLLDPEFLMEIGGRYVVQVYYDCYLLAVAREDAVVSGDIHRESIYNCYNFHQPPIQITTGGDYVMPDNWEILSAYSRKIQMDLSEQPGWYDTLFSDKMRLVTAEDFIRQMGILVDWLGGKQPEETEDTSAVLYSDLSFGETYRPEGLRSDSSSADIVAFSEEELYAGEIQVEFWEITVMDMQVKDYRYDVASDKFEPGGVLHMQNQSMLYQVQVEQVWYGQSVQAGETVLLEDLSYGKIDLGCLLSVGGRYVLPVINQGDTYPEWQEVVSGDVSLSSPYGIYYPYQPPIQRTTEGDYVLPSDWTTLTEVSRPVEMDLSQQGTEFSHYEDKMRLVTGEDFARQMGALVQKMQAAT